MYSVQSGHDQQGSDKIMSCCNVSNATIDHPYLMVYTCLHHPFMVTFIIGDGLLMLTMVLTNILPSTYHGLLNWGR